MSRAISFVTQLRSSASIAAIAVLAVSIDVTAQQIVPPEKIVGRQECKKCHASEHVAWEHSSHNTKAWSLLEHPKAEDFAKAINVSDIKGASACTQCHGTQTGNRSMREGVAIGIGPGGGRILRSRLSVLRSTRRKGNRSEQKDYSQRSHR